MKHTRDYLVGYKRPPSHTRFKKGQSGNPNGRPKKKPASNQLRELLAEALNKRVVITTKAGPRSITMFQAILRQIAAKAASGHKWATRFLLRFIGQVDADPYFSRVKIRISGTDAKL
jgi:hypothetical protein